LKGLDRADGQAMPAAVIVGMDTLQGLQTARILAGHGIRVIGLASDVHHFACRTRYCTRLIEVDTRGERLISALHRLGSELDQPAVLIPCTDLSVLGISANRQELESAYRFVLPDHATVETLIDKRRFLEYARGAGLPVPPFAVISSAAEAQAAADSLRFPCVLKPTVKTARWQAGTGAKAFRVENAREFMETFETCQQWADTLIAQEWIPGGESALYSCNCYFDRDSRPLATFIARKLRQWPPETGTSCLGEECRNDEVLAVSLQLFRAVGFRGMGYLEMKRDDRTGEHFIIEPNIGRPTRRSPIAENGGVELTYAIYCDALGLPPPDATVQRYTGAKWIYLRNDVLAAAQQWREGRLTLMGWWRSVRGVRRDAALSLTDPAPFVADLANTASKGLKRLRKRRLRNRSRSGRRTEQ
jgi:D-aspartate ligase